MSADFDFPILLGSAVPWIVGGVFAIIILVGVAFLVVFILARMKGKLEIALSKNGYAPGEILSGNLKLTVKKQLEGERLFVALVGYEEVKHRRTDSDGSTRVETERREVYRDELDLEGPGPVPAGAEKDYPFQIATPGTEQDVAAEAQSAMGKAMGALTSGLSMLSKIAGDTQLLWKVEARYQVKGLDLKASRKVTVSGGRRF